RVALSPRHADIVAILGAAGRVGVTAATLSHRLYGDGEHQVTVRAEVSRMRRALGALLATNPYRLGAGVELTVIESARA
ncbi:transcriptional regulator, partial [Nocardioides sp. GCM10030258]